MQIVIEWLEFIVSGLSFIHCCAIETAELWFNNACLDKMLAKGSNDARVLAPLQSLRGQQGIGGVEYGVVGPVNGCSHTHPTNARMSGVDG
jgi:hypothetical protein